MLQSVIRHLKENAFSAAIFATALLFTPLAHAATRGVIPVVGSTAGANGANFRTSLQLTNPTGAAISGKIIYRTQGVAGTANDASLAYTLAPHTTKSYDNIVDALGKSGLGSLDVTADGNMLPVVIARAFDDGGTNGTKGVSIALVNESNATMPGQLLTLVAPANSAARMNVGVRTLTAATKIRYIVYKADGSVRAVAAERSYAAEYFEQRPVADVAGVQLGANESLGALVVSGKAVLYATTTDNITNDPSIQFGGSANRIPVAAPASVNVETGQPITITLSAVDTDLEHLLFSISGAAQHGTLGTITRIDDHTVSVVYTPNAGFTGSDAFTFTVEDENGGSSSATVSLTVGTAATNHDPIASSVSATTPEDQALSVQLSGSDPDGDALTFSILTPPQHGTLGIVQSTGSNSATVVYTPNANYNGPDFFSYEVDDGRGGVATANVSLTVTPMNDAPTATNDAYSVLEDGMLTIAAPGVLGNDNDVDGDSLTASVVVTTTNGTLTLNPDGSLQYVPSPNFSGTDTFTYVANDGTTNSNTATVTITVTAVNDAPSFTKGADQTVLEDAAAQTVSGWATSLNAGANESAQTLHFNITGNTNPALLSALAIAANGDLTFTPAANANGSTTITITLQDNGGTLNGGVDTSAPQTFVINVTPVNDAPSFTKGADQTVLDSAGAQSVTPWATAISAGPADESSQTLTFQITNNTNPSLFSVQPSIDASGNLTYTPATAQQGTATLTVVLSDNGGTANGGVATSAPQTFTITVNHVNVAPSFTKGSDVTVNEDAGPQTQAGWATAISPGPAPVESSQTLTFVVTNNTNAALFSAGPSIAANGDLTFTPAANANGTATITVVLKDNGGTANGGSDTSAPQTFVINVNALNDAPVAVADGSSTNEDTPLNVSAPGVLANDSDVDTAPASLSAVLVSGPSNAASFTLNPNGSFSYTPNANFNGSDSFTYKVNDGSLDSNTVTVLITVNAVNDAPVVSGPATANTNQGTGLTFSTGNANAISVADVDAGASALQMTLTVNNGTITLGGTTNLTFTVGDGTADTTMVFTGTLADINAALEGLTYDPTSNFSGPSTLTIAANDQGATGAGGALQGQLAVAITVVPQNQPPVNSIPAAQSVNEDTTLTFASANSNVISISDPDAGSNPVQVTLTATNGTLTLGGVTNLAFTVGDGTADATMTFTGSIADINAALSGMQYVPSANYSGAATLTITTNDQGFSGPGGAKSDTDVLNINVNAVNDAPTVTVPGAQSVNEDAGLTFNGNVSVADIDAGTNAVQLTLTATNGTLSLGSLTGLTFSVGDGNSDAAMTFTGTLVDINAALNGMTFTGTADFSGSASIALTVDDQGNTGSGGAQSANGSISITINPVNDAPSFTKGADQTVNEDAAAQSVSGWATAISAGPNEASQNVTFTVTNDNNALFSVQPAVDPTGKLTYTLAANAFGTTTVTVTLKDDGGTANGGVDTSAPQTFTITVNAVNDAPSFTKGADQTVNEDAAAQSVSGWATAISAGPNEGGQVINFIVTNDNNPLFSVQPAVDSTGKLTYTLAANANGTATVSVQIHDDGGTANGGVDTSATQTFTITVNAVNDAPDFTIGSDQSLAEDAGAQSVPAFYTGETRGGGSDEASQTLTVTVTNNNNALFSVQPAIDQATGALTYTPAANAVGTALVTVKLQDNGGTANGGVDTTTKTFNITVSSINDAPTFTLGADPTSNEDAGAQSVNGFYTGEGPGGGSDEAGQTLTFSISNNNNALFSAQPAINRATGVLTYTAVANAFGTATVTVTLQDNGGTANGGVDTTQKTFLITVNAVNDAPSFTKGANQIAPPSTAKTVNGWATGLSVGPANESSQSLLPFVISGNTTPAIFSVAPAVDASGNLTYTTSATTGTSTITLAAKDDGGTANGGVDTSPTQTFTIINDAPPTVSTTTPSNSAVGVDPAAAIAITFSEQITAPAAATFKIECPSGTTKTFTGPVMNAGGTIATLTPSPALPGETTCTVTVFASGVVDTDAGQNMASNYVFSFTTGPKAVDDTTPENPLANNQMTSANVAGGAYSITTNDTLGGSTTIDTVMAITTIATNTITATTTNGGTVVVTVSGANMGQFVYTPAAGYSGADSFTYHLTDGSGPGSTGTVSFTVVGPPIWYVNAAAASSGNGTISSPFKAISDIANGTASHPQANQVIFFYENAAAYSGTLTLLAGQKLVGQDSTSTLASIAGVGTVPASAVALPTMNSATVPTTLTSGATTVTLGSGNTINGLTIGNSGTKILGNNFGTLTVADAILNGTGKALDLTTGTLSGGFISVATTSSTTQGISLSGVAGTFGMGSTTISGSTTQGILVGTTTGNINFGNTSVTGGTDAISLQNNSAGTRTFGTITTSGNSGIGFVHAGGGGAVTVTGAATFTNPGGTGIDIQSSTTAINFQGAVTVNKGSTAGTGVLLGATGTGNSGNITFNSLGITTSNGAGLVGAENSGTITVTNNTGSITSTGGPAINITRPSSTTPLALNFTTVSSTNSATTGVNFSRVSGSVNIGTTTSTNPAGIGINADNSTATFSFGTTTSNTSGGTAVNLNTNTGNMTFGSLNAAPDANQKGLSATSNTGALTTASGTITTSGNIAVEITGASAASKTPINVQFTAVNANGGTSGIVVTNTSTTGAPGGFKILGTGTAGSGGTIQNMNGANGAIAGNGIYLNNVSTVSLASMHLNDFQGNGIFGQAVRGFTANALVYSGLSGNATSDVGGVNYYYEGCLQLRDIGGTVSITNSTFSGAWNDSVFLMNNLGTAPTVALTFTGNTLGLIQGSTVNVTGNTALQVLQTDGTITANINNNNFTYWWGNAVTFQVYGTSTGNKVKMDSNTVSNTSGALAGSGGLWVAGGNLQYEITNNNIDHTDGTAISADRIKDGALLEGTISGNHIGISGVPNSGSHVGSGVFASHHSTGGTVVAIKNNIIRQINGGAAISTNSGDDTTAGGAGTVDMTITGNDIAEGGTDVNNIRWAVLITHGTQSGAGGGINDTDIGCYDIGGAGALKNVATNFNTNATVPGRTNAIRVNQRFGTTSRWPGYTGAATGAQSTTDIGTYLLGRNTFDNTLNANSSTGGFTNTIPAGSPCKQPNSFSVP